MAKEKKVVLGSQWEDIYTKQIEQTTRRKIWSLMANPDQIHDTHAYIKGVLEQDGKTKCKYYDFGVFKNFAEEVYQKAIERKQAREEQKKAEEEMRKKIEKNKQEIKE